MESHCSAAPAVGGVAREDAAGEYRRRAPAFDSAAVRCGVAGEGAVGECRKTSPYAAQGPAAVGKVVGKGAIGERGGGAVLAVHTTRAARRVTGEGAANECWGGVLAAVNSAAHALGGVAGKGAIDNQGRRSLAVHACPATVGVFSRGIATRDCEPLDAGRYVQALAVEDPALLLGMDGCAVGLARFTPQQDARFHDDVIFVVRAAGNQHGVSGAC